MHHALSALANDGTGCLLLAGAGVAVAAVAIAAVAVAAGLYLLLRSWPPGGPRIGE
jgi:hypothetical protein